MADHFLKQPETRKHDGHRKHGPTAGRSGKTVAATNRNAESGLVYAHHIAKPPEYRGENKGSYTAAGFWGILLDGWWGSQHGTPHLSDITSPRGQAKYWAFVSGFQGLPVLLGVDKLPNYNMPAQ
ncbi:hypothetical protein Bbelb_173510 [Branchiostoma belcheri]|nr:hypothetical protein Bbelb_173510 [Branchiostoma belcheri]